MTWSLNSDRPIYSQIVEVIEMQIVSGFYKPGARLPSVRELASEASVNPNTMQKALSELERSNLIITQRTSGRIVTEDTQMINKVKNELAAEQIKDFLVRMKELGFNEQEIILQIKAISSKGELSDGNIR